MTTENASAPVAIPQQPVQGEVVPRSGVGAPPPQEPAAFDPALEGFNQIAAERRSRVSEQPLIVPFGNGTIRLYRSMPAGFAFDAVEAEVDPHAMKRMLRSAIYEADLERFDAILKLPPDNVEGIDGKYLLGFVEQLGKLYGGLPLGG